MLSLEIKECNKCNAHKPIINRRHGLCDKCNWARLHPGGSYNEHRRKTQSSLLKTMVKKGSPGKLKNTRLKQVSKRQGVVNRELKEVYVEIDAERAQVCTGCGTMINLSNSHLIPRSVRGDLITAKQNITKHCLTVGAKVGCHDIWEKGLLSKKKTMLDFKQNIDYIRLMDTEYYNRIINGV